MANEITVKLKCSLENIYEMLENKGFKIVKKYYMDDTYFIPKSLALREKTTREILTGAIILRNIREELPSEKTIYKLTYKKKEIDQKRRYNKSKQN